MPTQPFSNPEYDKARASARFIFENVMQALFANQVKGFWFYDSDLCPGCLQSLEKDAMDFTEDDTISLVSYVYRERGVLIGYILCRSCMTRLGEQKRLHPEEEAPLQKTILENLIAAYHKHLQSLNA